MRCLCLSRHAWKLHSQSQELTPSPAYDGALHVAVDLDELSLGLALPLVGHALLVVVAVLDQIVIGAAGTDGDLGAIIICSVIIINTTIVCTMEGKEQLLGQPSCGTMRGAV